ncbi:uncharacterized protein LOC143213617 [Lasioglossum baleicum]|uniref:uncharacterized protein LOC143213617 n=1 Tax=Lasioglossum baleicum TaxID=434251 RepID=UPI003FCD7399
MAPPQKRGSRNSTGKERATETHYSHRRFRKRPEISRPLQPSQSLSVPELVYRLLNTDKHNQGTMSVQRGVKPSKDRAPYRDKIRKYQDLRDPSDDASSVHESSASATGSGYTKSGATSMENLSRVMKVTNTSWASGSADSSVSNVSIEPITLANSMDNTRALLKKKSLVQIINNYIKAGIEEGKRHAKRYIRKALSFGVKSGYLIPTDPQGQVIRVSPTLVESRRSDPQSRRRRRRARQGDGDLKYVDRKEQRRRPTPPLTSKRKLRRDTSLDRMVPQKRRKPSASKNPGMNYNLNYAATRKKDASAARQDAPGNRKKTDQVTRRPTAKGSAETIRRKRTTRQKDEMVEQRQSRKARSTKSPHTVKQAAKNDCSKCQEDVTDEDDNSTKSSDNDANQNTVPERRKSESSGGGCDIEGADENPGNLSRVVEDQVELSNNDEIGNNPVEDVH